jgi:type IV pilus assembly protein PilX
MIHRQQKFRDSHRGIVLVSSLLLLLVVTIMALAMYRSFGIQERIAGNTREKQRALQAAIGTEQFAENWLENSSNASAAVNAGIPSVADTQCANNVFVDANLGTGQTAGQICLNTMASLNILPTFLPWTSAVRYTPTNMNLTAATATTAMPDVYAGRPGFYITDLGPPAGGGQGELYKVDAYGYGTSANTIAVVESTVSITCIVCNPGAL